MNDLKVLKEEVGSFFSPKEAQAHFKSMLGELDFSRLKQATLGGEQESGFEQAFASLAYAYIKDKAPRLLDYIVGFQLVDRNEDNTKAMGVFGFKVGPQWLYAPVFFLNGDLKGHELLYVKKQDQFVPMKENWINYIMSRQPHIMGEGSDKQPHEMGQLMPQLSQLSIPPRNNKFASEQPALAPWFADTMPKWAQLMVTDPHKLGDIIDNGMPLGLNKTAAHLMGENINLLKQGHHLYRTVPAFKIGIDKFYGGPKLFTVVGEALKYANDATVKAAASIMPPANPSKPPQPEQPEKPKQPTAPKAPGVEKVSFGIMPPQAIKAAVGDKVTINVDTDRVITQNMPENTEEEREKLLKDPELVKDRRSGEEVSRVYNTEVKSELVNPHDTRRFLVLTKPGDFKKMLVIMNPHSGDGHKQWATVVDTDSGEWCNNHATEIWARPDMTEEDSDEDYRNWINEKSDTTSLSVGSTYVIVGKSCQGTVPFCVKEDKGDGCYKVEFYDQAGIKRPLGLKRHDDDENMRDPYLEDYRAHDAYVKINFREGSRFKSLNGVLYLPKDAKAIKIDKSDKEEQENKDESGMSYQSTNTPLMLGNIADVQNIILQKTAQIKLYPDASETVISSAKYGFVRLTNKAATYHLILDHGLTEDASHALIKDAQSRLGGIYRIKYAAEYPQEKQAINQGGIGGNIIQGAPGAPALPEAEMGYDSTYGGVPAQYDQTEFMPVTEMDSGMTDPDTYNPHNVPDPMVTQYAQEAAQSGKKEVFDTAMLSSMLRAVREDSIVDRYLGDLTKALDRLGRIVFMLYWHSEEFQERYGKSDLPELEDSLRNTFEGLGDVVLFLKQKTIDTDMSDGMGEPSVEEAALN